MKKGYCGIGIINGKTKENIGTLWRSAQLFGADFIFTIGERYKTQTSDTIKSERNIPLYHYEDYEDFKKHLPKNCDLVMIEQSDKSKPLSQAKHPRSCIYLLGAEDKGIPVDIQRGHQVWHIDTERSLNVAVAGSIVLYDRQTKNGITKDKLEGL